MSTHGHVFLAQSQAANHNIKIELKIQHRSLIIFLLDPMKFAFAPCEHANLVSQLGEPAAPTWPRRPREMRSGAGPRRWEVALGPPRTGAPVPEVTAALWQAPAPFALISPSYLLDLPVLYPGPRMDSVDWKLFWSCFGAVL